ncbi:MAG: sodium:solute symporter family protein [Calditrichia bacterium]
MILTIVLIYLSAVMMIGLLSNRLFRGTGEDYFVASRSIGPFVLLMTLFGTHMTAFSILGASGESYRIGLGVFTLMASSSALMIPAVFYFVGIRLWGIGKKHGYITQVQYFRNRWDSNALGYLIFTVLVALMIPYLLIGVMGGGQTLEAITGGDVPRWVGGLLICTVIYTYVSFGGLRGTAWVNTFQTTIFMILGATAFYIISSKLGGMSAILDKIEQSRPELLVRGDAIPPLKVLTYTLIPLSAGMFPHLFMHFLSAKSAATFRTPLIFYPLCMAIVWVPSVLLGMMGTLDFAGLQGGAVNTVLIKMIGSYAPGVLGGLLAAGVFAAIMSSLDSQSLALGTMFTRDIVEPLRVEKPLTEKQEIATGRLFVLLILLVTYGISQVADQSIFKLAIWSFSGFTALLPIVVAALFWKRSTKAGVIASALTVVVLWGVLFNAGSQIPGYTVGGTGIMPVAVMLLGSIVSIVVVSLLTKPPSDETLNQFFSK